MHEMIFIQDLAIIMLVAGIITVIFHKLKQPVVLGYILAGIIIGPHTPPFELVNDQQSIQIFAELGVIFLMFSLGLEFNLRHLRKVGLTAFIAALIEIIVMVWIGYEIGKAFSWNPIDSLFLGAMLAISSTTIIVKAIRDLKLQKESFSQLIYGILIVEDILGIAIIALLSGVGASHALTFSTMFATVGKLAIFLIVSLVVGILLIPRIINYVSKTHSEEILVISVLAICFGFCLIVIKLEYSVVLGAFLIGAIIAESKHLFDIEKMIAPLRNMFSAVFFVAVGLMFNPAVLLTHTLAIVVIIAAIIFGKVITCGFGALITGQNGKTSLQVGMGLAQIGEFSFIIAALGSQLSVTSDFLYPIAVAASIITTISTPYLIRFSPTLSDAIAKILPSKVVAISELYTTWVQSISMQESPSQVAQLIKRNLFKILINLAIVTMVFIVASYLAKVSIVTHNAVDISYLIYNLGWVGALLVSLPFLIAIYRKLNALSMLLAELSVKPEFAGQHTHAVRTVIATIIPAILMMVILLFIGLLSASILPSKELLIVIAVVVILLVAILWRWLVKLHTKLQLALLEGMKEDH